MCKNTWVMSTRFEANERLLSKWRRGNWKWLDVVWCPQHKGFHLSCDKAA